MILKVKNDKATNEAWNTLYKRFEKDGLLPGNSNEQKRVIFRTTGFRWAAIAAVACICIISAVLFKYMGTTDAKMYTLNNDENASTLVTTLEDGSIVYLNRQTSLEYPAHFEKDKREISMQGDAFFEISRNKNRPFFINTETARIEVLGTAFSVISKDAHSFLLSVKHGEVKVTLKKNSQSINVKAGESVLLQSDNLYKTALGDTRQFDEYLKRIHFKDERLADVVRIINMNIAADSGKLAISPQLGDRKLTLTFSNDTPETMAELICLALNLQFKRQENVISISEK